MNKKLFIGLAATVFCLNAGAAKDKKANDENAYVMVYHKDCDHSLHMALSYDGRVWTSLNNDNAVISGDTVAVQHGIRDPHIFRGPNGSFYLAMTDLHIFSQKKYADDPKYSKLSEYRDGEWERSGRQYGWGNNRGLVLMKSDDLIHWTRTNIDFSSFSCPTGITDIHGNPIPWSEVGCVWAPETVYDEEKGQLMIHFTTRMKTGKNMIYYAYINDDFNQLLSEPKLLFEAPLNADGVPAYNVIDSDICKSDNTYHLFYVSHEKAATVKHATSDKITGPYVMDDKYDDKEPQGHEAPNCWKISGENKYVVMYDNYSRNPHNFGFVETVDFQTFTPIGYFDAEGSPMKRTNFAEQKHAAVAPITLKEAKKLEKYWKKK
ncbi:MAG: glycoside hydrolase family 43 protein [Bacteroides sp.]|nr:glycoside hydrolase family 43 protein [Roseburia sp.]MCM1346760.1 glycoside hydrolase family 43 protein [Bacteroides sp.]MCM1420454.1 glycoside hydrolase family 43 protein [Bacteroides sp.]